MKMGILATFLSLVIGLLLGFVTRYSQGLIEITKAVPYIVAGLLVAGLTGMNPKQCPDCHRVSVLGSFSGALFKLGVRSKGSTVYAFGSCLGNQSSACFALLLAPLCSAAIDKACIVKTARHYVEFNVFELYRLGSEATGTRMGLADCRESTLHRAFCDWCYRANCWPCHALCCDQLVV